MYIFILYLIIFSTNKGKLKKNPSNIGALKCWYNFIDRKPRFLHDVFFYKYYLGCNKNSFFHKHKLIEFSIPFEVQNDWKPDRPNQLEKRHEQLKVSQFQVGFFQQKTY
jgi:hypothetical protein